MADEPSLDVLLVEDSATDALLAREALQAHAEFRLSHVERLGDAIRALVAGTYDVVLLDLGLPDSHGLSTLRSLLKAESGVPVVVMTASDDEELALEAVQAGRQDYLVKGQMVNGILGRAIRYAVERGRAEQSRRERTALASLNADVGLAFTRGGRCKRCCNIVPSRWSATWVEHSLEFGHSTGRRKFWSFRPARACTCISTDRTAE